MSTRRLTAMIAAEVRAQIARDNKFTDTQVAEYLGHNQQWYSRRKLGQVPYTAADLLQIASLLKVPVWRLYGLSDGPTSIPPNGGLNSDWSRAWMPSRADRSRTRLLNRGKLAELTSAKRAA